MSTNEHYHGEPSEKVPGDIQEQLDNLNKENFSLKEANKSFQTQIINIQKEQIIYLQNVSHQLVAPLHAMKMHIENLRGGKIFSAERAKKVLRSIYSQATISVHLAKNFALMSNLEADQTLAAQREPLELINLKQLMVNLADDFQPLGWDKEVHITVIDNPLEKAPPVLAIKNLISQVFSNIIENAVKYSNKLSEISIYGQHNSSSGTVSVCIANKGIPLIQDEISQVCNRGYRSKDAKNAYPAGTGFGLYIAEKIIDIHEGTIKACTDEKGLSVFEVTLSVKGLEGKAEQRAAKDVTHYR